MEEHYGPFGRVKIPCLHAVTEVVLEFMVIVMIPLAVGYQGHNPAVASAATD